MKVLAAFLVCWSVLAVETVTQTVAVSANNPKTFRLRSVNEGRGAMDATHIYKIRAGYALGQMTSGNIFRFNSSGEVLDQSVLPLPAGGFSNEYFLVSGNLILGFVKTEIQSQPTSGSFAFSSTSSPDFNGPEIVFTPVQDFIGSANLELIYRTSGNADIQIVQVTFNIANDAPVVALSASPSLIVSGSEVSLSTTTSDPNGHSVSVSYDYGDGQTGTTTTHTYAAPGVYTVTATANDGFGGTALAQTSVTVVGEDHLPTARFSTSAPAATVGEPVVFDAVFSTDPQNSPLTYKWDFGDGSPLGSGVTIAKEFAAAGSFNVTLTVTDGEGFSDSASLAFDITAAEVEQLGVSFSSRVNRSKVGSDTLNVTARFVAGAPIVEGASVAVELAGTRFDATLDKKLRRTQPDAKWTVKKIRNKDVVELKLQAKKRTLGTGFESLGVTQANNRASIPVRVECAGKTLVVKTQSEFKYNRPGTAFSGGGKSSE